MVDEETYNVLKGLAGEIESLKRGQSILESKIPKEEGKLPWYLAKSPDEMEQELTKQGRFVQPEAGLQDDIQNASRFFVKTNEKGDLLPGFESKYMPNAAATFMEMCETLTLSNVLWQFTPIGYLSALKGGWNIAMDGAENNAEKKIKEVKQNVNAISEANDVASYFSSQKKLTENLEGKKYEWKYSTANNRYELQPAPPDPTVTHKVHTLYRTRSGRLRKRIDMIDEGDHFQILPD